MKTDPKAAQTARTPRKRGQKKRANYVSAPKCDGYIQTESTLEATTAFALAMDPRVVKFRPQPCTFDLLSGRSYAKKEELLARHSIDGYRPRPYTPDFEVHTRDGRTSYVETKATRWMKEELHKEFLPIFFRSLGRNWALVTEETLTSTVASNIRTLKAVYGREPDTKTILVLSNLPKESILLGQLMSGFGLTSDELLAAILSGILHADLRTRRIGPTTLVSTLPSQPNNLEIIPL